jgi:hypothetical protein
MKGKDRPYVLLYFTGLVCLVAAIALYQLVVETKMIVPSFNLRPAFLWLCSVGVLLPLVAILARPKALFFAAAVFLFILLSMPRHFGGGWGTNSNTWSTTTYGWPADYLEVLYHKGGNWSADNRVWVPYEERSIHISWGKIALVLATSFIGACMLAGLRMLIDKWRANNTLEGIRRPADGSP